MRGTFRTIAAALCMAMLAAPAPADELRPDGEWITEGDRAKYLVTSCGGGNLCAVLLWIRPDLQNERNTKYLNSSIFDNLPPQGEDAWAGEVTLEGRTFRGTVEMVDYDEMKVTGCVFILCDTVMMSRLSENS